MTSDDQSLIESMLNALQAPQDSSQTPLGETTPLGGEFEGLWTRWIENVGPPDQRFPPLKDQQNQNDISTMALLKALSRLRKGKEVGQWLIRVDPEFSQFYYSNNEKEKENHELNVSWLHCVSWLGWVDVLMHNSDSVQSSFLNAVDSCEKTPLHFAARRGNVDVMKILLDYGKRYGTAKVEKESLLRAVCLSENPEAIDLVVDTFPETKLQVPGQWVPSPLAGALWFTFSDQKYVSASHIMEKWPKELERWKTSLKWWVHGLLLAASGGNSPQFVHLALKHGTSHTQTSLDYIGFVTSGLEEAIINDRPDNVAILMRAGASLLIPGDISDELASWRPPLDIAVDGRVSWLTVAALLNIPPSTLSAELSALGPPSSSVGGWPPLREEGSGKESILTLYVRLWEALMAHISARQLLDDPFRAYIAQTSIAQTSIAQTSIAQTSIAQTSLYDSLEGLDILLNAGMASQYAKGIFDQLDKDMKGKAKRQVLERFTKTHHLFVAKKSLRLCHRRRATVRFGVRQLKSPGFALHWCLSHVARLPLPVQDEIITMAGLNLRLTK